MTVPAPFAAILAHPSDPDARPAAPPPDPESWRLRARVRRLESRLADRDATVRRQAGLLRAIRRGRAARALRWAWALAVGWCLAGLLLRVVAP